MRLSEDLIKQTFSELQAAIKREDEGGAINAALALVSSTVQAFHSIADSLEKIANDRSSTGLFER